MCGCYCVPCRVPAFTRFYFPHFNSRILYCHVCARHTPRQGQQAVSKVCERRCEVRGEWYGSVGFKASTLRVEKNYSLSQLPVANTDYKHFILQVMHVCLYPEFASCYKATDGRHPHFPEEHHRCNCGYGYRWRQGCVGSSTCRCRYSALFRYAVLSYRLLMQRKITLPCYSFSSLLWHRSRRGLLPESRESSTSI